MNDNSYENRFYFSLNYLQNTKADILCFTLYYC